MSWKPGQRIFDLEEVKKALDSAEPVKNEDGGWEQQTFFGTVMSVKPSGKFYTPWANSNVDSCPCCKGSGNLRNPVGSKRGVERADRQRRRIFKGLERLGWSVQQIVNHPKLTKLSCLREYFNPGRFTCPLCHGVGSYEAYLDECWDAQAEEELSEINASLASGEGDPCDIFIIRQVDAPLQYTVIGYDTNGKKVTPDDVVGDPEGFDDESLQVVKQIAHQLMEDPDVLEVKVATCEQDDDDDGLVDELIHLVRENGEWPAGDVARLDALKHEDPKAIEAAA